jgi:hypothetical protein
VRRTVTPFFWQSEDIDGMARIGAVALKSQERDRPHFRAAAIIAGRNGNELFAINAVGGGDRLRVPALRQQVRAIREIGFLLVGHTYLIFMHFRPAAYLRYQQICQQTG